MRRIAKSLPFPFLQLTPLDLMRDMNGLFSHRGWPIVQHFANNILNTDYTLLYVYMDDLIIGHLEESGLAPWVTTIFDILQQHGFKIAPKQNTKSTPSSYIGIPINTHSSQSKWTPVNPA